MRMENISPSQHEATTEDFIQVATELFGEESNRVSDIEVILEEADKNPKVREERIYEAQAEIIEGIRKKEIQKAYHGYEMAEFLTKLHFPPDDMDKILYILYPDSYPPPETLPNFGRPDRLHS